MKKILYFVLVISCLSYISCSSGDDNDDYYNEPNDGGSHNSNNGNNNSGGNNQTEVFRLSDVQLSSSHTLSKGQNGYTTGDINIYVSNSSPLDIESVKVSLKSKNQSAITFSLGTIKGKGHEKSSGRFNIKNSQYPYILCTFTCKGKSYSKEYTY